MKNHTKVFYFITFNTKRLIDAKPLSIRFNKIDQLIRVYDGARY